MGGTTLSLTLPTGRDTWTVEDLWALPEAETACRIELQDGSLVVTPAPSADHQFALDRLHRALSAQLGEEFIIAWNRDVVMSTTSMRIPDLAVIPHAAHNRTRNHVEPDKVTIAVEVVSPSTKAQDRLIKPTEYAEAGIRGYWRLELAPQISLSAYALESGRYVEVGTWQGDDTARITAPVEVTIDLGSLAWSPRD